MPAGVFVVHLVQDFSLLVRMLGDTTAACVPDQAFAKPHLEVAELHMDLLRQCRHLAV